MSSKRRLRRKACEGKVRHESGAAAIQAIRSLDRSGSHAKRDAYKCRFCGGYHIGHRPNQQPDLRRGRRP